jgi:hypothetical protein
MRSRSRRSTARIATDAIGNPKSATRATVSSSKALGREWLMLITPTTSP